VHRWVGVIAPGPVDAVIFIVGKNVEKGNFSQKFFFFVVTFVVVVVV